MASVACPPPQVQPNCPGSFHPRGRLSLQGGGNERTPAALQRWGRQPIPHLAQTVLCNFPGPPRSLFACRCVSVLLSHEGDARSGRTPPGFCEPAGFGQVWRSLRGSHGAPRPDFRARGWGALSPPPLRSRRWRPARERRLIWGDCTNTRVCPCLRGQRRVSAAVCAF